MILIPIRALFFKIHNLGSCLFIDWTIFNSKQDDMHIYTNFQLFSRTVDCKKDTIPIHPVTVLIIFT